MPTRFFPETAGVALLLLGACAGLAAAPRSAGQRITVVADGRAAAIPVTLDPALIDPAGEHSVRILGTRGPLALVLDSYASRPQSMSRCQAGQERFVRLVDLAARRQRYAKLAESCLRNVVPGEPIAGWSADRRSFTVHLLSEPAVHVDVDARGHVVATPEKTP